MWFDKICRLCGQISETVTSIFHNDDKKINLELKLRKCLSISISEEDLKPKEICDNCFKIINDFYNFLIICEATDFEFDKILYENSSKWYQQEKQPTSTETIYENPSSATSNNQETVLFDTTEELYYQPVEQSEHKESEPTTPTSQTSNYYETVIEILKPPVVTIDNIDKKIINDSNKVNNITREKNHGKIKPFTCTVCNKQFMRRANVQIHMLNQHSTVRPFQCKICEKSFSTKRALHVHNLLHTEQYRCTYCGHVFAARGKLERHIRTHTGERPYVCVKCDKSFSDKRNLDAHIRVIHNNDNINDNKKPYECTKCDKSFRSKSHLNEHLRVHTMDMPFICDTCGKRFKWRANLILHMQSSHSGIYYQCTICKQKYTRSTKLKKHYERCHPNIKI